MLNRDPEGEALAALYLVIRGQIAAEMARQDVTRAELARRLDIRPSVLRKLMSPDQDILVSTAFLMARALGLRLEVTLRRDISPSCGRMGRRFQLGL